MSFERRRFLKHTMASLAASHIATGAAKVAKAVASERVRVGVMGAGGRALSLIQTFASNPEVDIVAIADVDESKLGPGVTAAAKLQGREPRVEKDFRRLIDNKTIDALVIGTPDHWHAIPTILACQAGKDVYVEKPDSHNIVEGMRMVAAMRRHNRIVQMGSQHRSTIRLQSAMEFVQSGKLGKVHVAKAWESTKQGAIGFPKDSEPPTGVDYDMWIGPATKRPFNVNRFHGKWRWLYDFGYGSRIASICVCRAGGETCRIADHGLCQWRKVAFRRCARIPRHHASELSIRDWDEFQAAYLRDAYLGSLLLFGRARGLRGLW